ncbi:MAG: AIR synthase-related protein, partial [Anaerolineae bacterium]
GSSEWFDDSERAADLATGWAAACNAAGVAWGGGETPALGGVVAPDGIDLAGACVGQIRPKDRLVMGDRLAPGDAVVLVGASGIHANGLTLARRIAEAHGDGYGTLYGEALLTPTHLYPRFLADVWAAGADVRYLSNITGHGWRKLMRAPRDLGYRMHFVPPLSPLFRFLVEQGGISPGEAYGSLNMGAGYAVFVPEADVAAVQAAAAGQGLAAWDAGRVEEGPRRVAIEAVGVVFEAGALRLS